MKFMIKVAPKKKILLEKKDNFLNEIKDIKKNAKELIVVYNPSEDMLYILLSTNDEKILNRALLLARKIGSITVSPVLQFP